MARELFRETLPNGNLIVSLVSEIEDGDFSANETRNRSLKENQSKLHNGEWNWLSQEHGAEIIWLDEHERTFGDAGDALGTSSSQKVLAITVADCLPLLLMEEGGILTLVHLGWRGIEQGLLEKTIKFYKMLTNISKKYIDFLTKTIESLRISTAIMKSTLSLFHPSWDLFYIDFYQMG